MNKVKKFIFIPIAIIIALAIVIIVLSVVKVNPLMDNFGDYSQVSLYVSSDANNAPDIIEDNVNVTQSAINEGLNEAGFSYMQAILEGNFSYGLKLKYNDDGSEAMVTASEIAGYGALENEYVIRLSFDKVKTLKVSGKEIRYDAVLIRLFESNGEIAEVECVPFMTANIGNENPDDTVGDDGITGSEYYQTNVLLIKMNTSREMLNIKELKEKYQF